ncbi:hypothetical protein [Staphylococcus epidermidis]|uniref:hypothetical protein n=1 Tax=Staphylococcus epidermidis TaxID=1282 RepID=UPI0011AA30F2|nr:hypothetical protein [Staphylococcus epidermidis]MBE7320131.1 hypothetical protein [Staphylococcus epidermidis]MCG2351653.1 hypothetical protein [Staphylococcus epidermidis]MEB6269272.1 hypothetical protein [Staphylococcus epidermidis]
MVVSPIDDSTENVDNDTVYMIYTGTNPKEEADLSTDMKLALSSVFNNQIKSDPKDVKLYNVSFDDKIVSPLSHLFYF